MRGREIVGNALGWLLVGAVAYMGYEATTTTVTVPVILPVLSTIGCVAALVDQVRRWRAQAAIARQADRRAVAPTVRDVLTESRTGDRIGDRERDIVAAALRTHFEAGRLDQSEFGDRLALALSAKRLAELADAVDGLPSEVDGR